MPPALLPPVVPSGTVLAPLRGEIAQKTALEDARVSSSCSHDTAAALLGLPAGEQESWAFLKLGSWAVMGAETSAPIINETSRQLNFTNEAGWGGTFRFSKQTVGLWNLGVPSVLEAARPRDRR